MKGRVFLAVVAALLVGSGGLGAPSDGSIRIMMTGDVMLGASEESAGP